MRAGAECYAEFVNHLKASLETVKSGRYGDTQALQLASECGPMSHYLEL